MYVDVHEYVFQTSATNECYFYLVGWLAPAIIGQSADRLRVRKDNCTAHGLAKTFPRHSCISSSSQMTTSITNRHVKRHGEGLTL